MKKTQLYEVFANIHATFVSFFSIVMFVALGVAVFLGLHWSAAALQSSIDDACVQSNLHDIEITYPTFLDLDQEQSIAQIEGVERVERSNFTYARIKQEAGVTRVKVQSIASTLDQPLVREGELPTKADQIAVMAQWANNSGVHVGDNIELRQDDDEDGDVDSLTTNKFTVTALVESPSYLSKDSSTYGITGGTPISCVMFVTPKSFGAATMIVGNTSLFVRCKDMANLSTFSDQYRETVTPVTKRVSDEVGRQLVEELKVYYDVFDKSRSMSTGFLDSAKSEIEAAEKSSSAIDEQLKQGAISEEEANRRKTAAYEPVRDRMVKSFSEKGIAPEALGLTITVADPDYEDVKDAVSVMRVLSDDFGEMTVSLMGQDTRVDDIPQRIESLDELFHKNGAQAFVNDRTHNGGIMFAQMLIDILERLRFSMAALFVVVGLLVCYSAISRMVHEQITQVGAKKALGIFVREVTLSYLLYSSIAVICGLAIGAVSATFVVQGILNPQLASCFVLGTYPRFFSLSDTLLIGGIELALILASTWLSCYSMLKRRTIELLAGTAPPKAVNHFFESWGVWQRLPLFGKTVVNNCLNDKRRVAGTLMGVAGCTALVVCALTLNNNVKESFDREYSNVYSFNAIANLDDKDKDALTNVTKTFADHSMPVAPVLKRTVVLGNSNDAGMPARLLVPTDEARFNERYHIHATTGDTPDLSQNGVWIAEGFGKTSGLKVGENVQIIDSIGEIRELPVLGYFEHYLIVPDVIMGAKTYENTYAISPAPNALLVDTNGENVAEVRESLTKTDGLVSISDDKALSQRGFNKFSKLSKTVVLVYVGLSALMAIVVLLNLDLMFIQEKKRELIVLMICGYSVRDAKRYVSYDTIFLTLIGILLGIALGVLAGYATIYTVEPANVTFIRGLNWKACGIGAGVSGFFALVMGLISLRRISRFKLTDVNRF